MIIELLSVGEENALTNAELSMASGLSSREVREYIRKERLSGEPICSSSRGFYKPESVKDIYKTISRLYKQAREVRKAAQAMKKCLEIYKKNDESEKDGCSQLLFNEGR